MLKGINRQMIEVSRPNDPYFEKMFLVVRSGAESAERDALHAQALQALRQAGSYSGLRRGRRRSLLIRIGWFLLLVVLGAVLGLLL